jgi:hypothetical protein
MRVRRPVSATRRDNAKEPGNLPFAPIADSGAVFHRVARKAVRR